MLSMLWLLALTAVLQAAPPEGTAVKEAEDLKLDGKSWYARDHFGGWYRGIPSGGKLICGYKSGMVEAAGSVDLSKTARYNVWVRYIDLLKYRNNIGFTVTLKQNGKVVAEKKFDTEASKRASTQGAKKWGRGYACFVWDHMTAELNAGPVEIILSKCDGKVKTSMARVVDCFVFVPDQNYQPKIADFFKPLYVKVKMLPEQAIPVVMHIFGRRPRKPWYIRHANINKNGLHIGANKGSQTVNRLKAGEESPWVDIAPLLAGMGRNQIEFSAMTSYHKAKPENAFFTLYFSRTKSMKGLVRKYSRKGSGAGIICNVDLTKLDKISSELDESAGNEARSKTVGEVPGKRPEIFPLGTGMCLDPQVSTEGAINKELSALSNIGLDMLKCAMPLAGSKTYAEHGFTRYMAGRFVFHYTKPYGCLNSPRIDRLDNALKNYLGELKKYGLEKKALFVNLMDEPGFKVAHVIKCPVCRKKFPDYLKANKVTLKTLGISDWKQALPTNAKKQAALYYWTVRYTNSIMVDYFKAATDIVQKYSPGMRTGANIATELVANMIHRGCDWFELYNSGALTYGWTEDWLNWTGSYQLAGYQLDAMRAACRSKKLPFGMYNILVERTPWEIQCKGFTEVGHGARGMYFFNYGPHYAISSDQNSHRKEIYEPIKRLTYAIGAVEKHIEASNVVKGDAAMLLSVTSDIWNYGGSGSWPDNLFGQERTYLHLLLRHCGLRLDILGEDDLGARLEKYKLLFITDSHLKKSAVKPLTQWVLAGGVLYLGAGAAEFDQYNKPLNLNAALNIKRGKFRKIQSPGRPPYEVPKRKVLDQIELSGERIPVVCGTQKLTGGKDLVKTLAGNSAVKVYKVGKGKVVSCGFFPATSYVKDASINRVKPKHGIMSCVKYPVAVRALMHKIIEEAKVSPKVKTDNPLVEVNLLETSDALVLCFANWTGKPQTVNVILKDYKKFAGIKNVTGKLELVANKNNMLKFKLSLQAGDFVVCTK
jgi:hypothetical protein